MASRPKRQSASKKHTSYDDDDFEEPLDSTRVSGMRRVYKLLKLRDVKSSLKDTEVHILWPDDGTWYMADVLQLNLKTLKAFVAYPLTHEEEEIDLAELIRDKCLAVVEHVPLGTKLKRGREIPFSEEDAAGAEFESDSEGEAEDEQQPGNQGGEQQQAAAAAAAGGTAPSSARKQQQPGSADQQQQRGQARGDEDSEFELDSSGAPSDDEQLDSDAMVSDDHAPSELGSEVSDELPLAFKQRSSSGKGKQGAAGQQKKKPHTTPTKGGQQQHGAAGARGSGHSNGPGAAAHQQQQQQVLGKRRASEGGQGSDAKRHAAGTPAAAAASGGGEQAGGGAEGVTQAMFDKLLQKKGGGVAAAAGGSGSGGAAAATPAAGSGGRSVSKLEPQRSLSKDEVRTKAGALLLQGLQMMVEEAHKRHAQQVQQAATAAARGGDGEQQQPEVPPLELPDITELSKEIEGEAFKHYGGVTNPYKQRMRQLGYNLRDPLNTALRQHVLSGAITPGRLVTMSAADLANKEMAEFRRKVEEEHNRSIELDVDTAAKFSTAAAWATRDEHLRAKEAELMGILVDQKQKQPQATPEPAAAAQQPQQQHADAAAGGRRGSEAGAGDGTGMQDAHMANAAGGGSDDGGGGGTPTRPASEEGDFSFDAARRRPGDSTEQRLRQQHSTQHSNLLAVGGEDSLVSAPSLSLGLGGAASLGGAGSAALHHVGSITSKASMSGGMPQPSAVAGIDWAAIRSQALKAAPAPAAKPAAAADDAPYNPLEDEDRPYDPTEGADDQQQQQQPGGSSDQAAVGGGGGDAFPDVPDMMPVVCARPLDAPPGPALRQVVWTGRFLTPHGPSFAANVSHLGGLGDIGGMLGPAHTGIDIMGRVALDKFSAFAEELRKSRSRTISLGLVGLAPGAEGGGADGGALAEMVSSYSAKGRIGKLNVAREVEGYLVAHSDFATRLLKTAYLVAPGYQQHLVPRQLPPATFLLLMVHRKDFVPPPLPPQQLQQLQQLSAPAADAAAADPRKRAAMAASGQQELPPPPPPPPAVSAAAGAPAATPPPIDLGSLSALAAALGLPGSNAAAPPPPPAAGGDMQQQQEMPVLPGPPPAGFGAAQGPGSGGAPAGLMAAMQQQQQHYTVDLRTLGQPSAPPPPPGQEQPGRFDPRQQQQMLPGPPPPHAGGGGPPPGPVIVLPHGTPLPPPGTSGIPDNAVFMTTDPATGALIHVGGPPPAPGSLPTMLPPGAGPPHGGCFGGMPPPPPGQGGVGGGYGGHPPHHHGMPPPPGMDGGGGDYGREGPPRQSRWGASPHDHPGPPPGRGGRGGGGRGGRGPPPRPMQRGAGGGGGYRH